MNWAISMAVGILVDGLAYAMILYIVSAGLSVTMGLMGFVNLAHGAFAMFGGYVALTLVNAWQVPFPIALIAAFAGGGAAGFLVERTIYARLYGAGVLDQVLMTIGVLFISMAAAAFVWGPLPQRIALPSYLTGQIDLGFRQLPTYRLFLIVAGLLAAAGLWFGLERTRFGACVRAAVDNRRMAESLGIDVRRLFSLTFALGSGLAGLGGALGAEILAISPSYGIEYLVYFLIVVSVGGLGSLRGAFIAALLLGIADYGGKYLLPELGGFFIYIAMIATLLWRPAGLFGRA